MSSTQSDFMTWSHGNNRATVRALLINRLQSGQEPRGPVHPYYQPWNGKILTPQKEAAKESSSSASKVVGSSASPPPGCPMHAGGGAGAGEKSRGESSKSGLFGSSASALNPLNRMPTLTQDRAPNQKVDLSTDRVMSTIPRLHDSAPKGGHPYEKGGNASACPVPHEERSAIVEGKQKSDQSSTDNPSAGHWEYPSPQQFYNALVRKGWETPEEHVEMMVMVHNFLNERAWQEVLDWEREMGVKDVENQLALARFQGKPGTLSPKARIFSWAAMIAPSRFSSEAPFDRHDWIVRRPSDSPTESGKEVRYVIDYYSAPDDPDTDEPVFHLDVRPALDSWEAAQARMKRTWAEWRNQDTKETV